MSDLERACWVAWEKGFRAGAGTYHEQPKNPYSFDGVEHPSPPEFPELFFRLDEDSMQTSARWTQQLREFKAAWDQWSASLR